MVRASLLLGAWLVAACGHKDDASSKPIPAVTPAAAPEPKPMPAADAAPAIAVPTGDPGRWHPLESDDSRKQQHWSADTPCVGHFDLQVAWTPVGCNGDLRDWVFEGRTEHGELGLGFRGANKVNLLARAEHDGHCDIHLELLETHEHFDVTLSIADAKITGSGSYKLRDLVGSHMPCSATFTFAGKENFEGE